MPMIRRLLPCRLVAPDYRRKGAGDRMCLLAEALRKVWGVG